MLVMAFAGTLPAAADAQGPITSLTVFGDSFSDTGNLFQAVGLPPAPYFNGRFSNGPVFVDYLASLLGRPGDATPAFLANLSSGNYAIGAARTVDAAVTQPGLGTQIVPGTASQIARYATRPGGAFDPTGLYVLFAGSNDLRDAGALTTDAARRAAAQTAALNIVAQANQLAVFGARSILVPFAPNLGLIPEATLIPGRSAILADLSSVFNLTLRSQLGTLRGANPAASFFELSVDNLYTNLLLDAGSGGVRYGLTNTMLPCLPGFAPPGTPVPPCDISLFADALHPTTRVHQLLASAAYDRVINGVDVAVIPEPATLVLVGSGLVTLLGGTLVRRRRAALRTA